MGLASNLDEFEHSINTTLHQAVVMVVQAVRTRTATPPQLTAIVDAMRDAYPGLMDLSTEVVDDPEYGANFDLAREINSQIRLVRALQSKVMEPETGRMRADVPLREAREVITSSTSVIQQLTKYHKEVMNMDRLRAVETAVLDTVKSLPEDVQERFMVALEQSLAATSSQ